MKKIYKVKEQFDKEILSTETYHRYQYAQTAKNGGKWSENPRANPDLLTEASGVWLTDDITKEVQERVQKLLQLSKQILTEQQYRVFVLIAVKDPALTEREAAKVLNISRGRVHQLWEAARIKMQKAYESRTI